MTTEGIAKVLGGRRAGVGWLARCLAHVDRGPELVDQRPQQRQSSDARHAECDVSGERCMGPVPMHIRPSCNVA
jgi:hypothetical protein